MNEEFYVIEKNEGNGLTCRYLSFAKNYLELHNRHQVTDRINDSIKFTDSESAEKMMKVLYITLKDWQVTGHIIC